MIEAEAKQLIKPQVILEGRPARVMIDGTIVQIGETFKGFLVISIENRSIIVEKQGVKVRIEI